MPKTENLGLYVIQDENEQILIFRKAHTLGEGSEDSPLSNEQLIDAAYAKLMQEKQNQLTPGDNITITPEGVISAASSLDEDRVNQLIDEAIGNALLKAY